MGKTGIEWTDYSWNPIRARNLKTGKVGWHCEHVTPGCEGCYAEGINMRLGTGLPFKPGHRRDVEIFLDEKMLELPYCWRRPRMIFPLSMTDMFGPFITDDMRAIMFETMRNTPQHTYQILTKRPDEMRRFVRSLEEPGKWAMWLSPWPIPNIWLGVSCEDQKRADERVPDLLDTPAAVRWVSGEPLLERIDFRPWLYEAGFCANCGDQSWYEGRRGCCDEPIPFTRPALNWIVAGGESGPRARPMHPDWPRSIRDQCAASGVAFHFKQWGEWAPHQPTAGGDLGGDVRAGRVRIVHPSGRSDVEVASASGGRSTERGSRYMARVGKRSASRILDGVTHDGYPETRA